MEDQKEITQFITKKPGMFFLAFSCSALDSLLNVLLLLSIGKFYELGLNEGHSGKGKLLDLFLPEITSLNTLYIVIGIFILLKAVLTFLDHYLNSVLSDYFVGYLKNILYSRHLGLSFSSHEKMDKSALNLKYGSEFSSIRDLMSKGVLDALADGIYLLLLILLFYSISAELTLLYLASIVFMLFVGWCISRFVNQHKSDKHSRKNAYLNFIHRSINNFIAIKSFRREKQEFAKHEKLVQTQIVASQKYAFSKAASEAAFPLMFFGLILSILFVSIQLSLPTSLVMSFILLTLYSQGALRRSLRLSTVWAQGLSSIESLHNITKETDNSVFADQPTQSEISKVQIQFDNPIFNRENDPSFDLEFSKNEIHGIQNHSPQERHRLSHLLLGLEELISTRITCNDAEIATTSAQFLLNNIAAVSQDVPLFGKTIFEAVSLSRKPERRERVAKLLIKMGLTNEENSESFLNQRLSEIDSKSNFFVVRKLQIARATLSKKTFVLICDPFAQLTKYERFEMVDLIHRLKKTKGVIIISENFPEGMILHKLYEL